MKAVVYMSLVCCCLGQSGSETSRSNACAMLQSSIGNESLSVGPNCDNLLVAHSESISGGFCLASMTAAGYYRAGSVNPVVELIAQLSGRHGTAPVVTGTNSGGTMFVVRYFAYRDLPLANKWTFPCYLLNSQYRSVCFFHGGFGTISEECYAETNNLISAATNLIYGQLIKQNGGPLGIVAVYTSVYFTFLSNLPLSAEDNDFLTFWTRHAHWNTNLQSSSNWVAAFTMVSPLEASGGTENYNYGFDSYLSRGMSTTLGNAWYSNMSVYSVASISANTLSGYNMMPFSFAGKQWDNSDDVSGLSATLKVTGLLISYIMLKRLVGQHNILVTTTAPQCQSGCPILDGCFTDHGPVTSVLAVASSMEAHLRPRHLSLLGPSHTMDSIKYLLGTGPLNVWIGSINFCPFTQVSICHMVTTTRELIIPLLPYDVSAQYRSIHSHYAVYRPDQQAIKPYCTDPLIFDHFSGACRGNSICHMSVDAVPGLANAIQFTMAAHFFMLSMLWLAATPIASRFVAQYIPSSMLSMQYYTDMEVWFPDFVATAPQKGGVGFTKVAGHSLLDYLTYLVQRLLKSEIYTRASAHAISTGHHPACGYQVFDASKAFDAIKI